MGSGCGPHPGSARTRGSLSILVTSEQTSTLLQKGWEGRECSPLLEMGSPPIVQKEKLRAMWGT